MGPPSDLGGCGALRLHGRLICIRSWVSPLAGMPRFRAWEGPEHGGSGNGSDYVAWAPGAQATPHSSGPGKVRNPEPASSGRLRPEGSRSPQDPAFEGALGTLCAQGRPVGLVTLRNGQNGCFPAFPAKAGFSADSGGPSLPSGPKVTERSKLARMASLRLLAIPGTLGTPGQLAGQDAQNPTPGRLNQQL